MVVLRGISSDDVVAESDGEEDGAEDAEEGACIVPRLSLACRPTGDLCRPTARQCLSIFAWVVLV